MAKLTKEDRQRNQRRRNRQMIGVVMSILVVLGCASLMRGAASLVSTVFDDTAEKVEYGTKLAGLVLFDPLPFDGVANIQDTTLREAAVWGTIYRIMATETGFDNYDRDEVTDQIMLPSIDVDAYLATIFGPDFQMTHKTFEMEGMTITYDDTLQCYYIPITSVVGSYSPEVVEFYKDSGRLYVTVGYIPVDNDSSILTSTSPATPTKYMDYIFERTDGNWYLVGLQESAMQAVVSESQTATATSVPALEDFEAVILEDLANSAATEDTASDAEEGEAEDAEAEASSDDAA
ncbi:MAG: Ice-structuring protein [Faecalibacterium sp.]